MTLNIPDSIFETYSEVVDYLYSSNEISENCKIYYPFTKQECPNCVYNPYGGGTNIYKPGGPEAFSFGLCPLCNGVGYKEVETTDTIKLRVYWSPKVWVKMNGVDKPDGKVQIIGKIENLPKVIRANKIEIFSDKTHLTSWMYNLDGEPIFHGFGAREFVALLKRI